MANARNKRCTPGITGPNLHHTHKTGGIFVFFSFPIPNKLHFDAAKTIDVNFFAFRAHHNGRLRAAHNRLLMHQGWPVGQIGGHTHQVVFVITGIAALLKIGVFGNKMLNFSDGKFAFLRGVGMFTHFKRATGKKLLQLVEALVRSRATSSASKRFFTRLLAPPWSCRPKSAYS